MGIGNSDYAQVKCNGCGAAGPLVMHRLNAAMISWNIRVGWEQQFLGK